MTVHPVDDREIALTDIVATMWRHRVWMFYSALAGAVLSALVWLVVPVIGGTTYRLSVYPDGAPIYSTDAIRTQLVAALENAGYSPKIARDSTVTIDLSGAAEGSQIYAIALTLSTNIHASVRRAAEQGGADCGELCVRLTAWADAHDAEMFNLISVSAAPRVVDRRAPLAFLAFAGAVGGTLFFILITPLIRRSRETGEVGNQ